ncbi:MAG TPA: low specificity L-threonine aldolase [Chthoniobacterales bacterium]|jgi:threonine aldolase|nr:low specificity L-threonine aldolase [Chthoniobacterales bacterium]
MTSSAGRHQFASDNTAGMSPEVLAALAEINRGAAESYGADEWSARVRDSVRALFETDCDVYLVSNGTAANALALAQLCQPFHSVVCHATAHIQTDECGAPEFFTRGSKLLLVAGDKGKIDIDQAEAAIARQPEVHAHKPRVISITQATELGTVYTPDEIAAIAKLAKQREMFLHMDGARFANAVAALGCSPKEITWQSGVDVLCFGGTKNGAAGAELIVFFQRDLSNEFDYRIKQGGQLASKARFLAAQWLALLQNDLWLRNARHANAIAAKLAERLRAAGKIDIVLPVEANSVFVRLPDSVFRKLNERGWHFYKFIEPDIYRLMCSRATTEAEIDQFAADLLR